MNEELEPTTEESAVDVIIVGAGPVGLSLALGLARSQKRVVVLEKEASTAEHSRAPAIWPRTQECLARLGVLERLVAEGVVRQELVLWDSHNDAPLFVLNLKEVAHETSYPRLLLLPQSITERLLAEALLTYETAELRFGCEALAVDQNAGEARVRYRSKSGDVISLTAPFVVGCDGAHSIVRKCIGAHLEGKTYPVHVALADVQLDGSDDLQFPRFSTKSGAAIGLRMGPDLWRLILPFVEDEESALNERIESAITELFPPQVRRTKNLIWKSGFRIHRRLSTRFVRSRVVLAGDAAHLNSPVGGQGMNVGIQDATWLTSRLLQALDENRLEPLNDYARRRLDAAGRVNAFTDRATRFLLGSGMLLGSGGRLLKPGLRLASFFLRLSAARRRLLRRLTMLDQPLP